MVVVAAVPADAAMPTKDRIPMTDRMMLHAMMPTMVARVYFKKSFIL
jgi:hypothetical protein